jgi:hypothetical protein
MLPPAAAQQPTMTHAEGHKKIKCVSIFSVSIFFSAVGYFLFHVPGRHSRRLSTPAVFVHTPAVDLPLLTPSVDSSLELRMIQP